MSRRAQVGWLKIIKFINSLERDQAEIQFHPRRSRPEVAPKDTAAAGYVKPAQVPAGWIPPLSLSAFPCHRAQNPYKPRHPWIPAGS
jgi:hypothetical protein